MNWFHHDPLVSGTVVRKNHTPAVQLPGISIAQEGKHSGDFAEGRGAQITPDNESWTLVVKGVTASGKQATRIFWVTGSLWGATAEGDPYTPEMSKQ